MSTETKNCSNCNHHQIVMGGNSVCNLYNKYCISAKIHCKMECWEKLPKQKKTTK
jgi:hypothetical protein